jgi:hypothetical protein
MVCVNTYSLVGEYVLDMHHIFSQQLVRGYFQNQFRVTSYKHVGRPTQDSQKRDEALEKVTNVFMEQFTLPTDTNELPNLPTRGDVET